MLITAVTIELGSDEGGFRVEGARPSGDETPAVPVNTLLQWWPDREADLSGFLVSTGSQWGPFSVVVQVHDADPGPVETDWQDVVEVSVEIDDEITVGEIVDGPVDSVTAAPGSYRLRVAAKGRTESAQRDFAFPDEEDDDETEPDPLEHYLLTLWPAPTAPPHVIRQDSRYAQDQISPRPREQSVHEHNGLAAAWAIVRDLRGEPGARPLPGDLGDVTLEIEVPGTRTRVFNRVQHVFGWPPARGGMSGGPDSPTQFHDATLPDFEGPYEQVGHIETSTVTAEKPQRIVFRWNWLLDEPVPLTSRVRLLSEDSLVTVELEQIQGRDDARTLVRLRHEGAPLVWAEDLRALWTWHVTMRASL